MENNDLYNKYQAGFRPDHRTTDHIFIIKTLVNKYIHNLKKPIYTCFVDFCKAFNSVWHSGLFKKLLDLKIGGNFYKIIQFMYSNSKCIAKKRSSYPKHVMHIEEADRETAETYAFQHLYK